MARACAFRFLLLAQFCRTHCGEEAVSGGRTAVFYLTKALRIAISLGSKKERSFLARAATAVRTALGIRRITLTPCFGLINPVSVSVRKVPEPSRSRFSRYFWALTRKTRCDFSAASSSFKNCTRQDKRFPRRSVSCLPVPRREPHASALNTPKPCSDQSL